MKLHEWFGTRGTRYVYERAGILLSRYGVSSAKAIERVNRCVQILTENGCAPTFPTPGSVVQHDPLAIRRLQERGAEIAVHSYNHIDLRVYPLAEARQQLLHAAETFARQGIAVYGFRCPYLGCPAGLVSSLPKGVFSYSSNQAVAWHVGEHLQHVASSAILSSLYCFYNPHLAENFVCVPWFDSGMVEIPVCVPDDLQLHDGIGLDFEQIARVWCHILEETHRRGELFDVMFHPELADECDSPLVALLCRAKELQPDVWVASLGDISAWWYEKARFEIQSTQVPDGIVLSFKCSPRATILARGVGADTAVWHGGYHRISSKPLTVCSRQRPFVGLENAPEELCAFLRDQGYIVETGAAAKACSVFIDVDTLTKLPGRVDLINYIENTTGPLVRYWRWPHGARSALSITGDLDALSLRDYVSRVFIR